MTCRKCIRWDECSKKDGTTRFYGKEIAADNAEVLCEEFSDDPLLGKTVTGIWTDGDTVVLDIGEDRRRGEENARRRDAKEVS